MIDDDKGLPAMPDLPQTLRLNAVLAADTSIEPIFAFAVKEFAAKPEAGVVHWVTASAVKAKRSHDKAIVPGAPTRDDFARLGVEAFSEGFSIQGKRFVLAVKPFQNGGRGKASETYGLEAGWQVSVTARDLSGVNEREFAQMLGLLRAMMTALTDSMPPLRAEIRRDSDSFIGPVPPLAEPEVAMACLPTDLVPQDYADPDGFWSAWDRVDYVGKGLALVQRGADVVAEPGFKSISLRSGLAMGRAAKAGKTSYFLPEPSETEAALLEAGESCLEQVGYNAVDHSLEFTAMLPGNAHLPARDLFHLVQYLENGTAGGEPVDLVIVTFPTREMAEAEARPLQDIGARVQYLSPKGEWVVLEG
jgi:hypothetical protein